MEEREQFIRVLAIQESVRIVTQRTSGRSPGRLD